MLVGSIREVSSDNPIISGSERQKFNRLIEHVDAPTREQIHSLEGNSSIAFWLPTDRRVAGFAQIYLQEGISSLLTGKGALNLSAISKLSIQAFYKGFLETLDVVNVHLMLAPMQEFFVQPKQFQAAVNGERNPPYTELPARKNPRWITISDYKERSRNSEQPLVKNFFSLTEREWEDFQKIMDKQPVHRRRFYLISVTAVCPLLQRIHLILTCFQLQEYGESGGLFHAKCVLVPSIAMINLALYLKSRALNAPDIRTHPLFGEVNAEEVWEMKENLESPLGLYLPLTGPVSRKTDVDGWKGVGPYTFYLHDIYHCLREMMLSKGHSLGRHKCVRRLQEIIKNETNPADKANCIALRDFLIDGELMHSQGKNPSCVFVEQIGPEKFGVIFSLPKILWRDEYKQAILKDIAQRPDKWAKLLIDYDSFERKDRMELFKHYTDAVIRRWSSNSVLNAPTDPEKLRGERISIQNMGSTGICDTTLHPVTFVYNSKIERLTANHVVAVGSTINHLIASGNVHLWNCNIVNGAIDGEMSIVG